MPFVRRTEIPIFDPSCLVVVMIATSFLPSTMFTTLVWQRDKLSSQLLIASRSREPAHASVRGSFGNVHAGGPTEKTRSQLD
ncbi:hypothetical protein DFH94DRAFT_846068, partial [Russula ochroleuca]